MLTAASLVFRNNMALRLRPFFHHSRLMHQVSVKLISPSVVEFSFGGEVAELHSRWLRERCVCPKCVMPSTRQPLKDIHLIAGKNPSLVQLTNAHMSGDQLHVQFADGHKSTFSLEDIRRDFDEFDQVGVQTGAVPLPTKVPWLGSNFSPPSFKVEDLRTSAGLNRFLEQFIRFGVALVKNVPSLDGEVVKFAKGFGTVRDTNWGLFFNVLSKPDPASKLEDLAYSSEKIDPHVDNPYRDPTPGVQLLHCLANECPDGQGMSGVVDGLYCAEELRKKDPRAFAVLCSVHVRWENDYPLTSTRPHIDADPQTGVISAIRYSSKSGGYSPVIPVEPNPDAGEEVVAEDFYAAKTRLAQIIHDPQNLYTFTLRAGDCLLVDNTRIFHSRTSFDPSSGLRHLQGCYMDHDSIKSAFWRSKRDQLSFPLAALSSSSQQQQQQQSQRMVSYTAMKDGSAADYRFTAKLYAEDQKANQVNRILDMLRAQRGPHTKLGARVDLYEHALQAATRAVRNNASTDTIVGALLHDVGELLVPSCHGDVAAALLQPYINPAMHWVLAHHEIFQGYYYFHHLGMNRNVRERFRDDAAYDECVAFCELYDQSSFDPNYKSLPLEHFEPLVREVFARPAYWWNPKHPKAGAVTGGGAAH